MLTVRIRDGKKVGSGINIPDPQHWVEQIEQIILAEINSKNLKHHAFYYFILGTVPIITSFVPINQLGRELQKYRENFVGAFNSLC
jgi:hypothetical protein